MWTKLYVIGLSLGLSAGLAPCAVARHIEAGQATTYSTFNIGDFRRINFQQSFDSAPIVVVTASNQGSDSSTLRLRNVTPTGFDIAPVESPGEDGPHLAMTFDYVALEAGVTTLPNGIIVAAGFHDTNTVQAQGNVGVATGWDTLSFGATLSANASVIASLQTTNSEENLIPTEVSQPFLSVALRNANTSSVQIALERSEVAAGTVNTETIGWIAFPNGGTGSLSDISGNEINWDARVTPDNIVGFDNGCTANVFTGTAWPTARVIGTKNTRDGADGGWLRRCSISSTQIGFVVDEDVANDAERAHTNERAGLLSFSDSFHAILSGEVTARKDVEMVAVSDYALPGNFVRYRLSANSVGNSAIDTGSMVFTDALPAETALRVSDIDSPGSGPVRFVDGNPASGLSYNYAGLSSLTDDVDFSNNDGTSYDYIPAPDGNGVDGNVTHIRIAPSGPFLAASNGTPNFTVEFEALIR